MAQLEVATGLDPLDRGMRMNVGDFLAWSGDHAGAVTELRRVLDLDPHHLPAHVRLARSLAVLGERGAALRELAIVVARAAPPVALELTAVCHGLLGDAERARAARQELERLVAGGHAPALAAANAAAAMGDRPAALAALERAWEERAPMLPFIHLHAPTRALRDDPGFAALGARVGIPRYVAR
jgi:tetratricopeptide (TPR) repeat protein